MDIILIGEKLKTVPLGLCTSQRCSLSQLRFDIILSVLPNSLRKRSKKSSDWEGIFKTVIVNRLQNCLFRKICKFDNFCKTFIIDKNNLKRF